MDYYRAALYSLIDFYVAKAYITIEVSFAEVVIMKTTVVNM